MSETAPCGAVGLPWIMLVPHSADMSDVRRYEQVLRAAGFDCRISREMEEVPKSRGLVVLCGVSKNLTRAHVAVHVIETLYPDVEILILTHHRDPKNIIRFTTPRTTVLSMPFSEGELVGKARELIERTAASK